jgi:hypothetical protein
LEAYNGVAVLAQNSSLSVRGAVSNSLLVPCNLSRLRRRPRRPLILPRICSAVNLPPTKREARDKPLRDMRTLSLVPFPPSQNPVPRRATSDAWHAPQSSGRKFCSREQYPQIIRFAFSLGWSLTASWHLRVVNRADPYIHHRLLTCRTGTPCCSTKTCKRCQIRLLFHWVGKGGMLIPKPAVGFGIVRAAAAVGQLLADLDPELLLLCNS